MHTHPSVVLDWDLQALYLFAFCCRFILPLQSLALLQWPMPDLVFCACRHARLVLQPKAVAGAAAARCALLAPHKDLWLGPALLRAGVQPLPCAQIPAHSHRQVLSMLCHSWNMCKIGLRNCLLVMSLQTQCINGRLRHIETAMCSCRFTPSLFVYS